MSKKGEKVVPEPNGFVQMWNDAIEADPYWQFEDLLDDDPELAEIIWHNMRVQIFIEKRLNQLARRHE